MTLQSLTWTGSAPAGNPALVVDGGDLDIEGQYVATRANSYNNTATLFTATSSEGTLSVTRLSTGDWRLIVRGAVALDAYQSFPTYSFDHGIQAGDLVQWRAWYRPSTGASGLRLRINGAWVPDVTGTTSGGALVAPTAVTLGAGVERDATKPEAFVAHSLAELPVATTPQFLLLGDSTVSGYAASTTHLISTANRVYLESERSTKAGWGVLAVPSDTSAGQQAKFAAHAWSSQGTVQAVIIQSGINERAGTATASIAALQSLVNAVRAALPSAVVLVAETTPIGRASSGFYIPWQTDHNAAIRGVGPTPITNVHGRISGHWAILDDGAGSLKDEYYYSDGLGLHENNPGREVVAAAYRDALALVGLIGEGTKADLLRLLLQNVAAPLIGDAVGLRPSAVAGSLYVSLHTASPGEAGDQTTSETAYGSYARVAVARSTSSWTVSGNVGSNTSPVTFPASSGTAAALTHWGLGTASSGAGVLLASGALVAPVTVVNGRTPTAAAGAITVTLH